MRKVFLSAVSAAISLTVLFSCSKENGSRNDIDVPQNVLISFGQKYPGATDVVWKSTGNYWVASFKAPAESPISGYGSSAWFDNTGKWHMTEIDHTLESLPEAVLTAFRNSEFASWKVEDIDVIVRNDAETVYVIEVESGRDGLEYDLHYLSDGTLAKTIQDADEDFDHEEFIPVPLPENIQSYLNLNHPGSKLIDVDIEKGGMFEVEIFDGAKKKDLIFDQSGQWAETRWEILLEELPEVVKETVRQEAAGWEIDGISYVENTSGKFYEAEMENDADIEKIIRIAEDGKVIGGQF